MTGLCSKPACPLANSSYATVLEKKGKLYLTIKTPERGFMPDRMFEWIELSDNYAKAIEQIDEHLMYFSKFSIHKCKQRLTKLTELIKRKRRMRIRGTNEIEGINKYTERRDDTRMTKAEKVLGIDKKIEVELVERLKLGTFGELYEDLYNVHKGAFKEYLGENEVEGELDDEEEEDDEEVDYENDLEHVFDPENEDEEEEEVEKPIRTKPKKIEVALENEEEVPRSKKHKRN